MNIPPKVVSWLLGAGIATATAIGVETLAGHGDAMAALAGMTAAEISTLHAALFFGTVWIVSSLRIHRFRALWRVGFGLKALRGASGSLQPRGPKARAAAGGSAGGAGASGFPGRPASPGNDTGRRHDPVCANDNGATSQVLDNFRG